MRTLHFDTIDSTNAEAHRLGLDGERGPLWIVADRQTGGRGRLGRSWVSEPGNLYATYLVTLDVPPPAAVQMSFVASLAVHDLAAALLGTGQGLRLKWPNDVLLDGAKISGILPEVVARPGPGQTTVAVGIGINLAHRPAGLPAARLGPHEPAKALASLDERLSHWIGIWRLGFTDIRRAWEARALRGEVRALVDGAETRGSFAGLAPDGALIVAIANGVSKHIHAGEVRYAALRP